MAKQKYYVVWKGRETGVYESWEDCNMQINGFKGGEYKSFKTLELANKAFSEKYNDYKGKGGLETTLTNEELTLIGKPILDSISVDAACSGNPGVMEYKGVDTRTKEVIFRKGTYKDSNNNIGEFLALVHGLAYLKKNGDNRPIYSDSKVAIGWVRDIKVRTLNPQTENNSDTFELIRRALEWLKNNKYSNKILKWETKAWGEIPADFGRK